MQPQPLRGQEVGECAVGHRDRLSRACIDDLDSPPGHRRTHAETERLRDRFLGSETGRQEREPAPLRALAAGGVARLFLRSQHALDEALSEARLRCGDALDLDQIGADSVDHVGPAAISRALRIAAEYLRTVASSPNSRASAIRAWPMDTSSIPGTAARKGPRLARFRSWPAFRPSPSFSAASAARR